MFYQQNTSALAAPAGSRLPLHSDDSTEADGISSDWSKMTCCDEVSMNCFLAYEESKGAPDRTVGDSPDKERSNSNQPRSTVLRMQGNLSSGFTRSILNETHTLCREEKCGGSTLLKIL
jgi:hypothetical protein